MLLSGQAPGLHGQPAPLTYVAAQLGHAKPTTTLAWYAHWIPSESSVRYVDALDSRVANDSEHRSDAILAPLWHQRAASHSAIETDDDESLEIPAELKNGPPRDRTEDPLIKSQLLYQLS